MERVQQEQKSKVSPRAVFLARLLYWSLLLAAPVVTFMFAYYGGLPCFIAAQTFYYFWMQKRGIFVVSDTNLAWWRTTWIYQYFYLPTIDESIPTINEPFEYKKRLKFYLIFGILFILFSMEVFYLPFALTRYHLEDMVVIQGSYAGSQKLSRKNHCGYYLLTFRRDDGSQVQLFSFETNNKMILALEEGMKSNEKYTIWGEPRNYDLMPECRKSLSLAQIVGQKYKSMFMRRDYAAENAIGVCLLVIGIVMLLRVVAAGKMLKNLKKKRYRREHP
jgi:hypothetical protein